MTLSKTLNGLCLALFVFNTACQKHNDEFTPCITYFPNPITICNRPSAFPELNSQESRTDWGKEFRTGYAFIDEQDYYRAITSFKRALVFLPPKEKERQYQAQYAIYLSYYLAYKYQEAIEAFESSQLQHVCKTFPAFRELLISLYESYKKTGYDEKACGILTVIEQEYPDLSSQLDLSSALSKGNISKIQEKASELPLESGVNLFLSDFFCDVKSPERARLYQTILPGAGYYYVGQKNAAVTSFLLNSLFIWAAVHFFQQGNVAAGIITTSLETGWYFGGINGVGLAAREYNERIYETRGRDFMRSRGLFPILMLQTSF